MNKFLTKYLNLIVIIVGLVNIGIVLIFELPCPWKNNFNIDCVGCGVTRMFKSLFSLDIYQAFRFNPFVFCLMIIGIIYLIYYLICKIKDIKYYKIKDRDLMILLVLVIVYTIMRNIPLFYFLKPTVVK